MVIATFNYPHNYTKAGCLAVLELAGRRGELVSCQELVATTRFSRGSLQSLLAKWTRWRYVRRSQQYGVYRYRLALKGKRFLAVVPDAYWQRLAEEIPELEGYEPPVVSAVGVKPEATKPVRFKVQSLRNTITDG